MKTEYAKDFVLGTDNEHMTFSCDFPRICVMNLEHHGNVWRHLHHFVEMVYVDNGFTLHSGYSRTGIKTAGDMFIIRPSVVHSYGSAYHTRIYNCLFYPDDLLNSPYAERFRALPVFFQLLDGSESLPAIRVPTSARQKVTLLLEHIIWERQSRGTNWQEHLFEDLYTLLEMFSAFLSDSNPEKEEQSGYTGYVFKALQFIEEHYKKPVTQTEIAAAAGLSPDYMTRRFKAILGMTPSEYVRSLRIARSMDMLARSDMSIAEIAEQVGFCELSLFSRVFKQITGVSPTAFRKSSGQNMDMNSNPDKKATERTER